MLWLQLSPEQKGLIPERYGGMDIGERKVRGTPTSHSETHLFVQPGEYLADVFFVIAPSSQELEPPANPGRFI